MRDAGAGFVPCHDLGDLPGGIHLADGAGFDGGRGAIGAGNGLDDFLIPILARDAVDVGFVAQGASEPEEVAVAVHTHDFLAGGHVRRQGRRGGAGCG